MYIIFIYSIISIIRFATEITLSVFDLEGGALWHDSFTVDRSTSGLSTNRHNWGQHLVKMGKLTRLTN